MYWYSATGEILTYITTWEKQLWTVLCWMNFAEILSVFIFHGLFTSSWKNIQTRYALITARTLETGISNKKKLSILSTKLEVKGFIQGVVFMRDLYHRARYTVSVWLNLYAYFEREHGCPRLWVEIRSTVLTSFSRISLGKLNET